MAVVIYRTKARKDLDRIYWNGIMQFGTRVASLIPAKNRNAWQKMLKDKCMGRPSRKNKSR